MGMEKPSRENMYQAEEMGIQSTNNRCIVPSQGDNQQMERS